jgi:hypothetical protein
VIHPQKRRQGHYNNSSLETISQESLPDLLTQPVLFLNYVQKSILSQRSLSEIIIDISFNCDLFCTDKNNTRVGAIIKIDNSQKHSVMKANLSLQKLSDDYKKLGVNFSYTLE